MNKKIASNTLAQVISKALTAGISIFLIGILTKYLPIELYGSYNKVYNYLGIFAFLADLWLYAITIREISAKKESAEKIIWNVLTLRTFMGLVIWGLALFIALFLPWYNDSLTLGAICIIGAFTLVSLINSSILALMQSQMKMEFSLISIVSGKILNLLGVMLFLMYIFVDTSQSALAFLSVFMIAFVGISLTTLMNYLYARKIIPIRYRFDTRYIKHIFKISLPYGIALFLSVVYFKVDVILLSLLETPEKADISIALYSLPMKIVEVLMVLWGFYLNSILPSLTEKFSEKKYSEISHMLSISLKILVSFALLIFIMGNLFSRELIMLFATGEYLEPSSHTYSSVDVLSLVVGVLLFHFISLAFIYILIASNRQKLLLWINFAITLVNIIWNFILIPHYSFMWAAFTTLVSQILLMNITAYVVIKKIPIEIRIVKHIVFSFIFAGALYFGAASIFAHIDISYLLKLFVFGPILLLVYVAWEFFVSKKLFRS